MKTISQLKSEIAAQMVIRRGPQKTKQERRIVMRAKKRIEYLNTLLLYLETGPTERRLSLRLKLLESQYKAMVKNYFGDDVMVTRKDRNLFNKEMGGGKILAQIENIKYLLA